MLPLSLAGCCSARTRAALTRKAGTRSATAHTGTSRRGAGISPTRDSSSSNITIRLPACRASSNRGLRQCGASPDDCSITAGKSPRMRCSVNRYTYGMIPTLPRSQFVDRDGIRLHHLDWGNHGRHPIILVHGSRLHAHVWNDFSRRLNDRFHIIAVDQRGHGDSGWGGQDGYQLEDLYRDLRAVIQARGFARYTLIGHSLGGRVSMLYAHRHQAELDRLILVDITPGRANAAPRAEASPSSEAPHLRD